MARIGRKDRGLLSRIDAAGNKLWYVRLWHQGKERRFGSFTTKTKAREFYEKAKYEQQEGRFFPERYQHGGYDLVVDFLVHHAMRRTQRRDQRSEKGFQTWWANWFQGKRLNAVTPDALDHARRQLLTQGSDPSANPPRPCSPQRVNRYLAWLRHALNVAIRDGKLSNNPVRKLSMYREYSGSTRYLTVEEEQALCAAIGPTYAPWIRLAILTGLRRSEQFGLQWADVDLVHGLVTLRHTKAGSVQHTPLNAEAKYLLERLHVVAEARTIATPALRSPWIFPSENPSQPIDPCNFYRRRYLKAVKDARLEGVTWHTLRHTFASRLAMSGVGEYDIASCLRHAGTSLVRRYAHLSPTHLRAVVEHVSSYGIVSPPPASAPNRESPSSGQIPTGTVTGTGKGAGLEVSPSVEVLAKYGAGDPD